MNLPSNEAYRGKMTNVDLVGSVRYIVKQYTYPGGRQLLAQVSGVAAIAAMTLVAAGIVAVGIQTNSPVWSIACLAIWFLLIGWTVGLTMINVYPTVWVSDEHLTISAFLFVRVNVPWTGIIDVGAGHVPFGHILVRARHITPFHRVYGWMCSRTLYPSFVVGRGIQEREELLGQIKERARDA